MAILDDGNPARCEAQPELRVGVTGHRVLAESGRVQSGIAEALGRIEASHPGLSLVIISTLAEGADRLVAEAVLKRPGARLEAVLPRPKFDFMNDFATAESKEEFLGFLERADRVVELPAHADREQAYAVANERLLSESEVLVAVWDGQEAQGEDGTAEVIAGARARSLPLAWIHAGNRKPGTMEPTSLGAEQGRVTYEGL